jgi:hypothetical protein
VSLHHIASNDRVVRAIASGNRTLFQTNNGIIQMEMSRLSRRIAGIHV